MRVERLSDQVSNDPNKLKREMERKRLFTATEDEIMLRAWLRCALHQYLHITFAVQCVLTVLQTLCSEGPSMMSNSIRN